MKKFIVILILVLLTCGCGSVQEPRVLLDDSKTILGAYIQSEYIISDELSGNVVVADGKYVFITKEWLNWVYASWRRKQIALKLVNWTPRNDCNKQARSYQVHAAEKFAQQPVGSDAEGVTLFVRYYMTDSGQGHAICTAMEEDKTILNFEEQIGAYLELSKKEKKSTWLIGD